jgi:methylmalonyl-CoA mutase C-terminal domain/subunit
MSAVRRVVLAKVGLDGHDVGIAIVAKALVAAGYEVVYLGKRVTSREIVDAAVAEDADVIGISCLSGGLGHFAVDLVHRLREQQADVPVIAGGIDEPGEIERMLREGTYRYVPPGTDTDAVVGAFDDAANRREPTGVKP